MILYRAMSWQELSKYLSDITIRPVPGLPSKNTMFDCKQCLMPGQAGMPALVKVKGEFRICPTYRLITEKYTDIRRRMAEKEAAKASARREAVGFVPKFALYRKEREAKW